LVTPFNNGKVDFEKYGELIDWQIKEGIQGIVTCGTTGEGATLNDKEHKEVIKFCVEKVDGRVPVIAGTGSNDTEYGLQLSQYADKVGVDALMMVTPYYNKTTQKGLVKHYQYLANNVEKPIILYNVPSRTGLKMDVDTVVELSKHPRIAALKDATGDIVYTADLISKISGNDFVVYSGNDDMIIPILSLGGVGVISVLSNVLPFETQKMVEKYLLGETEEARMMQLDLMDFIHNLFIETNPIPVKTALNCMGHKVGGFRLPLCEMAPENEIKLREAMNRIGLKVVKE
jgi:4-hydroxy-tetrahydrodipicolinate synthase